MKTLRKLLEFTIVGNRLTMWLVFSSVLSDGPMCVISLVLPTSGFVSFPTICPGTCLLGTLVLSVTL